MGTRTMTKTKTFAALAIALLVLVGLGTGCSQKYSAERDGKKAGKAICDVRNADNADEAKAAADRAQKQLDDLASKYALYTAEDRQDIQNNLADLSEHKIQGNDAPRQPGSRRPPAQRRQHSQRHQRGQPGRVGRHPRGTLHLHRLTRTVWVRSPGFPSDRRNRWPSWRCWAPGATEATTPRRHRHPDCWAVQPRQHSRTPRYQGSTRTCSASTCTHRRP